MTDLNYQIIENRPKNAFPTNFGAEKLKTMLEGMKKDGTGYPLAYMMVMLMGDSMAINEAGIVKLAEKQRVQDELMTDYNELSSIISRMQSEAISSPGGKLPKEKAESFAREMNTVASRLFGEGARMVPDGQNGFKIEPGQNSNLRKFMDTLDGDPYKNPVVGLINSLGNMLFNDWSTVKPGDHNSTGDKPSGLPLPNVPLGEALVNGKLSDKLVEWVNIMAYNFHMKVNKPTGIPQGTDYLGQLFTQLDSTKNALTGMGQQNLTVLQAKTANEKTLHDIGSTSVSNADDEIKKIISETK